MQHHRTKTSILLAGLVALGFGSPAMAEGDNATSGNGNAPVPEQKLKQFTLAMNDVREIRSEYGPKLQKADGQEERDQLKKEGQQEMIEAIRDNGLEPNEYNRIGNRLRSDEELQQRVQELMEQQSS